MDIKDTFMSELAVNDLVALGSLGVAVMALVVAPWVNTRISKRHVIAPMRQLWINALRDKLAEFISLVSIERLHICPNENESEEFKKEALKEDRSRYERLMLLATSIELHINPSESAHADLALKINEIVESYHNNKDTLSPAM